MEIISAIGRKKKAVTGNTCGISVPVVFYLKGGTEMANKRVENPKRIKKPEAYEYEQDYIKKNVKFISVPFNVTKPNEEKLYNWLKQNGKIGALIKHLLAKEMEKNS